MIPPILGESFAQSASLNQGRTTIGSLNSDPNFSSDLISSALMANQATKASADNITQGFRDTLGAITGSKAIDEQGNEIYGLRNGGLLGDAQRNEANAIYNEQYNEAKREQLGKNLRDQNNIMDSIQNNETLQSLLNKDKEITREQNEIQQKQQMVGDAQNSFNQSVVDYTNQKAQSILGTNQSFGDVRDNLEAIFINATGLDIKEALNGLEHIVTDANGNKSIGSTQVSGLYEAFKNKGYTKEQIDQLISTARIVSNIETDRRNIENGIMDDETRNRVMGGTYNRLGQLGYTPQASGSLVSQIARLGPTTLANAEKNYKFLALDAQERKLHNNDSIIAEQSKPTRETLGGGYSGSYSSNSKTTLSSKQNGVNGDSGSNQPSDTKPTETNRWEDYDPQEHFIGIGTNNLFDAQYKDLVAKRDTQTGRIVMGYNDGNGNIDTTKNVYDISDSNTFNNRKQAIEEIKEIMSVDKSKSDRKNKERLIENILKKYNLKETRKVSDIYNLFESKRIGPLNLTYDKLIFDGGQTRKHNLKYYTEGKGTLFSSNAGVLREDINFNEKISSSSKSNNNSSKFTYPEIAKELLNDRKNGYSAIKTKLQELIGRNDKPDEQWNEIAQTVFNGKYSAEQLKQTYNQLEGLGYDITTEEEMIKKLKDNGINVDLSGIPNELNSMVAGNTLYDLKSYLKQSTSKNPKISYAPNGGITIGQFAINAYGKVMKEADDKYKEKPSGNPFEMVTESIKKLKNSDEFKNWEGDDISKEAILTQAWILGLGSFMYNLENDGKQLTRETDLSKIGNFVDDNIRKVLKSLGLDIKENDYSKVPNFALKYYKQQARKI